MKSRDQKRWSISANVVMMLLSLLAILPILLLIIASFTDESTALQNGFSYIPEQFSLEAYKYIASEAGTLAKAYMMTIIVTVIGTTVSVIITSLLAYMLSQKDLPGRKVLTFLVVFTMLFNGGLVPTYIMYVKYFHIKNTIFALLIPTLLMSAFIVLLVKNYFENSIPVELYEAARIDGASEIFIFAKIAFPLAVPILATIGLLSGIGYWNDWQNGLYYLSDPKLYTIQNILNQINLDIAFLAQNASAGTNLADLPTTTVRMAIAVVGILPIIIVYPFFQKYFAKGITMGSVKG